MRSSITLLLLTLLADLGASGAEARVYFSRVEALELAFPDADRVESETVVLDDAQARAVQALAREKLESRLVTLFKGVRQGEVLGYAFIDVHTVRTLPEAFLIVLSPDGEVRSLRVLAFYEPEEYLPHERWLEQFDQRRLAPALRLGGEIHGIAGSTLSARAVTGGVRRSLALFEVLVRSGGAAPAAHPASPPAAGAPSLGTASGGR